MRQCVLLNSGFPQYPKVLTIFSPNQMFLIHESTFFLTTSITSFAFSYKKQKQKEEKQMEFRQLPLGSRLIFKIPQKLYGKHYSVLENHEFSEM